MDWKYELMLGPPSAVQTQEPVATDREMVEHFVDACSPRISIPKRLSPIMSPLYEDMQSLIRTLPLRTLLLAPCMCGAVDSLLNHSLTMAVKWTANGAKRSSNYA